MTTAYWCMLIAAFLPLAFTGVAKFSGPGFNNNRPRDFQAGLTGFRQRAHWAHLNSFEAFPPFAAAVVMAHQFRMASGHRRIVDRILDRGVATNHAFALDLEDPTIVATAQQRQEHRPIRPVTSAWRTAIPP